MFVTFENCPFLTLLAPKKQVAAFSLHIGFMCFWKDVLARNTNIFVPVFTLTPSTT